MGRGKHRNGKSIIKDGHYRIENTSKSSWKYYKTKSHLKKGDDFIIETAIELEKKVDAFGHFGLVWGFDEERKYLNQFTLSADGKRALIMHFEKNHHIIGNHQKFQYYFDIVLNFHLNLQQ